MLMNTFDGDLIPKKPLMAETIRPPTLRAQDAAALTALTIPSRRPRSNSRPDWNSHEPALRKGDVTWEMTRPAVAPTDASRSPTPRTPPTHPPPGIGERAHLPPDHLPH